MNANGATALICAISFIHQELVDIILNHTVDLSVEGKEGFTTKNHAKKLGLERLQQLLQ
jgi:ankyrin repeat protein